MSDTRSIDFGRHLHRVRTEVFDQSLRAFSKTISVSPSYIGKMENGEVGVPRRDTILSIAGRLGMDPDPFLIKAGYVPESQQRGEDDEYLLLRIGMLTPGQRAAVLAYIDHVKDFNVLRGDTPVG